MRCMGTLRKPGRLSIPIYGKMPPNKRPVQATVLSVWLKEHGVTRKEFAKRVGCSEKMVDYWCGGQCIPTLVYAFMIEKVTRGEVSVAMWLGTEIGQRLWKCVEDKARAV